MSVRYVSLVGGLAYIRYIFSVTYVSIEVHLPVCTGGDSMFLIRWGQMPAIASTYSNNFLR